MLPDSGLVARKLADSDRILSAAPSYLAARGRPVDPADLARHDCLQFTRLASFPEWRLRRDGGRVSVRVSGPLSADDAEGLVPAAVAGHGVMVASEWLIGPHLAAGRLERVLDGWAVEGEGAIHLVRPSARFTAAKSRAFADWIAARMSPPPWMVP